MFSVNFRNVLFLVIFAPMVALPMLRQSTDKIETLIQQGKYATACKEVEYFVSGDFSKTEKVDVLRFAIDKAKYFASLSKDLNEEADTASTIDMALEDLSRCIIVNLSETSLSDAISFAKDILPLVHNKWPDIQELIIEELFYQNETPSFELLASLIDQYLLPNGAQQIDMFMCYLALHIETVHNILGSLLTPHNMTVFPILGDSGLNAVEVGKKYVKYFFENGQEIVKKQITENYEYLRTKAKESDDEEDWCTNILRNKNRECFLKMYMNAQAGSVASLALSSALLMKREDAISYIGEIYNKLIEFGYLIVAENLKKYITNQPKNKSADESFSAAYFIINPRHVLSDKLVKIPEFLSQAFITH